MNTLRKPRWGRIALLVVAAGLAAAAIALPAQAATHTAHRSCVSGAVGSSYYWRQPGSVSVWFNSEDSPAGCYQIRAKMESDSNNVYTSGWISYVGSTGTATDAPYDNSDLLWGEIEKHAPGSPNCTKKALYPVAKPWTSTPTKC